MTNNSQDAECEVSAGNHEEVDFDRRKTNRQITIFRLAKIKSGMVEGWGFIKNISNNGVMVEIHPSFELGRTATVALTDEVELVGSIRWRKDALTGIQFDKAINATELLTNLTIRKKDRPARLPRVRMKEHINLRIGSKLLKAEIWDISPAGIRIKTPHLFEEGSKLTLLVPELGDIIGAVIWQKNSDAGIKFQERVSVPQLTVWLSAYYAKTQATNNESMMMDRSASALEYHVVGFDALDNPTAISVRQSATDALNDFHAAMNEFYKVTVHNGDGVEMFSSVLVQQAFRERVELSRKF